MEENYHAVQEQKESKALEICSLVFGILSIVCCCCYGVFGIVGLILSIVALATGKKSGFSIAGLICSIVGIVLTIIILWIGFNSPEYEEMMRAYMQAIQ